MEWEDQALVLAASRLEEGKAVLHLLTREHGRHAGLLRLSRRNAQMTEPMSEAQIRWSARLEEQLGSVQADLLACHAARHFDDPKRLAALAATAQLLREALPEREPMPALFDATRIWLELLDGPFWGPALVKLELGLLASLGGGLDLARCAVSGETAHLTHVSPRTGRAVGREAAAPYEGTGKLLVLPGFLGGPAVADDAADLAAGLTLTGHFLARSIFHPMNRPLPPARAALAETLAR